MLFRYVKSNTNAQVLNPYKIRVDSQLGRLLKVLRDSAGLEIIGKFPQSDGANQQGGRLTNPVKVPIIYMIVQS